MPRHTRQSRNLAWFNLLVALLVLAAAASAQTVQQKRDFEAARVALDAGQLEFAEKRFEEFVTANPDSPLVPEALLRQAQARHRLGRHDDALALLRQHLPQAGVQVDQFEFWIAETLFAKGEIAQAEQAFAELISRHSQSPLVLSAAVRQAYTIYQRKDFERTVALLSASEGPFQTARSREPGALPAITGLLLLAESHFELGQLPAAETTLAQLPSEGLPTLPAWRRLALTARVLTGTGRAAEAVALMPAVVQAAVNTENPNLIAETHSLHAGILEKLERKAEALDALEPNLRREVSTEWRREALVRAIQLSLDVKGPEGTVQRLELLSAEGLDEPARDLVQLTMGELRLRQFYALPDDQRVPEGPLVPAVSNVLASAQRHFNNVIGGHTNSPYLGKAWLNRGWCDWQLRQWEPAATAFREASQRLPSGRDQAVAVFKLGDSLYRLGQFEAALTNYGRVVREFGDLPAIKEGLLDQAYYQMISAAVRTGNRQEAEYAVSAVLGLFPGNFFAERGLLLVGQFLNEVRDPAKARAVLEEFANRFEGSTLEPERELAIARTHVSESNWTEAIAIFDRWVERHTNHVSLATAEFDRAFALSQAGLEIQALAAFTNFVSRFNTNLLTPKALLWIGRHFDNRQEYTEAERYYQLIFPNNATNWPVSALTYEARVLASRAAFRRQGYSDARRYLTNLLNESVCPVEAPAEVGSGCCPRALYAEALFALGDVIMAEPAEEMGRFGIARNAFDRIVKEFPATPLVPSALGRFGDCSLQLKLYAEAISAYNACIQHPRATVTERGLAEIGIGQVLEKQAAAAEGAEQQALMTAAQERYLNVFLQGNLRTQEGEVRDLSLVQAAGMNAARLSESRRDWQGAAKLYTRLLEMLPSLKDYLDPRIRQMEERARAGG